MRHPIAPCSAATFGLIPRQLRLDEKVQSPVDRRLPYVLATISQLVRQVVHRFMAFRLEQSHRDRFTLMRYRQASLMKVAAEQVHHQHRAADGGPGGDDL